MSRKKQPAYRPVSTPAYVPWVDRLLKLPRLARIGIAALFALSVTLALSPIVDGIYLNFLFTPETVMVPALVSAGFGLVMYVVGWQLIVGYVGEMPPARLVILWYVGVGVLALVLVMILLVTGFASGNAPIT